MKTIRYPGWLLWLAIGMVQPGTAMGERTNRVHRAEMEVFWFEHLTFELYRLERDYAAQEVICRKILEKDPVNHPALQTLVTSYRLRNEAILSDMVKKYGEVIEVEPVLTQPVQAAKMLAQLKRKAGEEDILWKSWHDLYQEDFTKFSGRFSEPVFDRMEARIRKYIQRSPKDLEKKLTELSRLLTARGEPLMVAMVENYLSASFPENVKLLSQAVDSLQAVGLQEAVNRILKTYRSKENVSLGLLKFVTRECMQQGMYADVVSYAGRWRDLEPDNPTPASLEGAAWIKLNDFGKAEGSLLAATRIAGHSTQCYVLLSRIYAEYGDLNQTLIWLERLKPHLTDEELVDMLLSRPYDRMPLLLLKLDHR